MGTKNATIRISDELAEYLTRNGDSINQAIISEITNLRRIRNVSLGELKGLFKPQEWIFIADTFNGTIIDEVFCCNVNAFIASCEDSERFDGKAQLHGVKLPEFIEKVKTLKGANIEAIYTRVNEFWSNSNKTDINEWAKF